MGVGQEGRTLTGPWGLFVTRQHLLLELLILIPYGLLYQPCAGGGLSAVNAIGTELKPGIDPMAMDGIR